MANVNIKLPNGVVEVRKVVTALEKYGNYVVALEKTPTPDIENNNIVVDVYILENGTYQPAPFDAPVWDNVKHALSDCIHANEMVEKDGVQVPRVTSEEYRVLGTEISVAMGKHPLSLREANHSDILKNYELFLSSLEKKETVEAPSIVPQTILESQPVTTAPLEEKATDSMNMPQGVIPDVQNLSVPKEEVASVQPTVQDIPVMETPIIVDSFANIPQPEFLSNPQPKEVMPQSEPLNVAPEGKKVDEPIVSFPTAAPINTFVSPAPASSVIAPEPVIQEVQSIIPETLVAKEETTLAPEVQKNNVVVDSYINRAADLEKRLDQSIAKLDKAVLAFKSEVQEISKGISELVKEGNAYHSLAGQAFDKVQEVQAMAMNKNMNSFPNAIIENPEGPSLGKVA